MLSKAGSIWPKSSYSLGQLIKAQDIRKKQIRPENPQPVVGPCDTLTGQEREVIDFIALGMTNPQIGARTNRSENAVKKTVVAVLDKLGFSIRLEIAKWRLSHPYTVTSDGKATERSGITGSEEAGPVDVGTAGCRQLSQAKCMDQVSA